MAYKPNDHYARKARQQDYRARSVFNPRGRLLGIDLTPVDLPLPNAHFVAGDIHMADWGSLFEQAGIRPPVDLVISDMAPKTTGSKITDQARSAELCEMALLVATKYLARGGHFVAKFFDGPDFQAYRAQLQRLFDRVAISRPKATRSSSKELFFIGLGYNGKSYEESMPL